VEYACVEKSIKLPKPKISTALLYVEGSINENTNPSILSVLSHTPTDWPLYIYYAPIKKDPYHYPWLTNLYFNEMGKVQKRKIIYRELPEKYYKHAQNALALDPDFWQNFSEDYILLFHTDSSMCPRQNIPYTLQDFFEFDYVGAPWIEPFLTKGNRVFVGNGGFSLRNRTHMLSCLKTFPKFGQEDVFYAYCTILTGRFAPLHIAKYFSVETYPPAPEGAFGVHGICRYARYYGCNSSWTNDWIQKCPDSEFLFENGKKGCSWCFSMITTF